MPKFCVELKKIVDDSYEIEIGRNLVNTLVSDLADGLCGKASSLAVITDSNVRALYGEPIANALRKAGFSAEVFSFEAGEKSKTRETKAKIEDEMLEKGFRRDCAVIAVGGGVVTDLAGFLAGTYGRGVPFVNFATTLLASADASVGGKTAVDTPLATNLIGIFNQPKKVYIDINAWKTLPKRQLSSGLAETIKHACIANADFFDYLENNADKVFDFTPEVCEYIAQMNCKIKYSVVMQDERETALREVLNLGHTVGRAIETASDYNLLHGEALSIGLVAQAKLAVKYNYLTDYEANRVISLLERVGLPTKIPSYIDRENLVAKLYTDKKVRGGKLRFVFQQGIGKVMCFDNSNYARLVSQSDVREILAQM